MEEDKVTIGTWGMGHYNPFSNCIHKLHSIPSIEVNSIKEAYDLTRYINNYHDSKFDFKDPKDYIDPNTIIPIVPTEIDEIVKSIEEKRIVFEEDMKKLYGPAVYTRIVTGVKQTHSNHYYLDITLVAELDKNYRGKD